MFQRVAKRGDRVANLEVQRHSSFLTGGGPNTIQQYLREGLIDELHVAISPVLLGGGERLFEGTDVRALGYECVQFVASEKATHVVLRRQGRNETSNNRLQRAALPRRR